MGLRFRLGEVPYRFWSRVVNHPDPATVSCWLWTGRSNGRGYGVVWDGLREIGAHRFAYQSTIGRIPNGYEIDHLCVRPMCVNPLHLEPVTSFENKVRARLRRLYARRGTTPPDFRTILPEDHGLSEAWI